MVPFTLLRTGSGRMSLLKNFVHIEFILGRHRLRGQVPRDKSLHPRPVQRFYAVFLPAWSVWKVSFLWFIAFSSGLVEILGAQRILISIPFQLMILCNYHTQSTISNIFAWLRSIFGASCSRMVHQCSLPRTFGDSFKAWLPKNILLTMFRGLCGGD
jgi:hypothetical protein